MLPTSLVSPKPEARAAAGRPPLAPAALFGRKPAAILFALVLLRLFAPNAAVKAQWGDEGLTDPPPLIISEFRLSGPASDLDEFVEIYNNSDAVLTVNAPDGSAGYALVASDGVTRFVIPNGTLIPARGHYLGVNSAGYSLSAYPAGDGATATGDAAYNADIPENAGIALFATSNPSNFKSGWRLDAAGSDEEADALYREGAGYPSLSFGRMQGSFTRRFCLAPLTCAGLPRDTDNNAADFRFADTLYSDAGAGETLGAPGPEGLSSPTRRAGAGLSASLFDPQADAYTYPNVFRDPYDASINAAFGTVSFNRTFTNNTGAAITRLRFRVADITTAAYKDEAVADLRPRNSYPFPMTLTDGSTPAVEGTVREEPPAQGARGGGFNTTLSADSVTPSTPLAPGASLNLQFTAGIEHPGDFRLCVVVETLPAASSGVLCFDGNTETGAPTPTPTPGVPANDNFSQAQLISGASGTVTGSNVGATKEPGEPPHAGRAGGKSVWYRWQAPASGSVNFTTAGSDFDTALGAYTGGAVDSLTTVAGDDDGGPGSTSSVVFTATAGTTYHIAVDGHSFGEAAESGNISLGWSFTAPTPTPSPTPTPDGCVMTFTNPAPIVMADPNPCPVNVTCVNPVDSPTVPYPSGIPVAGFKGPISKVKVTLSKLSHTRPSDIDVMLVGPDGRSALIMSDAGRAAGASDVTLTLDDEAAEVLPLGTLTTGTYRPKDWDELFDTRDVLPPPAPATPDNSALSVFNGADPNGVWSLYVFDDWQDDSGQFATGWSIEITAGCPNANDAPVARDDAYEVNPGTTLTVTAPGVLANDSDAEGDALRAVLASAPANGNVALNGDGSFTYTPNPGFVGADSFTYRADDGRAASDVATVRLSVTNRAPRARDDAYEVDKGAALSVPAPGVLGNDSDPDGDPLTARGYVGPMHGTLTLNRDGSFVYTPNPGFVGDDSFKYRAEDGRTESLAATVRINVRGDTEAPALAASVAVTSLRQRDSALVNVGLSAEAADGGGGPVRVSVEVFGDEDDEAPTSPGVVNSPDARDIAPGTLRLRAERADAGDGRVYLVVVTATDADGNTSRRCLTVVVPKSQSAKSAEAAAAQAAAARQYAEANNGAPPPGYFRVGDGAVIGPNQ